MELVCNNIVVYIPGVVKKEVVDAGKEKGCQDSYVVEDNIKADFVKIVKSSAKFDNGDEALLALFNKKDYYAVATDDAKLVRHLKMKGIPFILPGLLIFILMENNLIKKAQALMALKQLSEFIK